MGPGSPRGPASPGPYLPLGLFLLSVPPGPEGLLLLSVLLLPVRPFLLVVLPGLADLFLPAAPSLLSVPPGPGGLLLPAAPSLLSVPPDPEGLFLPAVPQDLANQALPAARQGPGDLPAPDSSDSSRIYYIHYTFPIHLSAPDHIPIFILCIQVLSVQHIKKIRPCLKAGGFLQQRP